MRKKKNQVCGIAATCAIWTGIVTRLHKNLSTLKKLLKSKLPITAIFERLCIEKKVRQIFSVFSTCSFLILMCEIVPGCKQMLFLEHAQSDEWDSLLVKNY